MRSSPDHPVLADVLANLRAQLGEPTAARVDAHVAEWLQHHLPHQSDEIDLGLNLQEKQGGQSHAATIAKRSAF
jgi:hypothetical protein